MAALLMRWANRLGLSEKVTNLESQFSNGYLIGEICFLHSVITKEELKKLGKNHDDLQTRADNFDILEPVFLERLGFEMFDTKLISKVIMEEPGAIAKLLFQVKCKLEPDAAPEKKKTLCMEEIEKKRKEAAALKTGKVRARRVPEPNPVMELAVRGKLNSKQLDEALHTAHFANTRIERELQVDEQVEREERRLKAEIEVQCANKIALIREKREASIVEKEASVIGWKVNERVKRDRLERELQHELTCRAREQAKHIKARVDHKEQVVSGTATFERNLKRLGLENTLDDEEQSAELVRFIERKQGEPYSKVVQDAIAVGKVDDEKYMIKLKAQRLEAAEGRKKREQRRRKLLIDQQLVQKQVSYKIQNDTIMKRIDAESETERDKAHRNRRRRRKANKRVEKINIHTTQAVEVRNRKFQASFFKKKQEYIACHAQSVRDLQLLKESLSEEKEAKLERKKAKHVDLAKGTTDLLVGLVFEVISHRFPNEDSSSVISMHPQVWRDLKRDFVRGVTPLFPLPGSVCDPTPDLSQFEKGEFAPSRDLCQEVSLDAQISACESFGLDVSPVEVVLDKLRVFTTTETTMHPSLFSCPERLVCLLPGEFQPVFATRLKFHFGFNVLSLDQYFKEVDEWLLTQEQKESETEKEEPVGKKSKKPGKKEEVSLADFTRDQLVEQLAKLDDVEMRKSSTELVYLLARDISDAAGSNTLLNGVLCTKQQVQLLEYLLLDDKDTYPTVDAFIKAQNAATAETMPSLKVTTCIVSGADKIDDMIGYFSTFGKVVDTFVKQEAEDEKEGEGEEVEEKKLEAEEDQEGEPNVLQKFTRLFSEQACCVLNESVDRASDLLVHYLESLELPAEFKEQVIDVSAAAEIKESLLQVRERHDTRLIVAFNDLLTIKNEVASAVENLRESGTRLVVGDENHLPEGFVSSPEQLKQQAISDWIEQIEYMKPLEEYSQVDKSIDDLGHKLWDIAHEYSRVVQSIVEEWHQQDAYSEWATSIVEKFSKVIEIEQEYYTELRECLKDYYSRVEPTVEGGGEGEGEDGQSVAAPLFELSDDQTSLPEEFVSKAKTAFRSANLRQVRESNNSTDEASVCLSYVNMYFQVWTNQLCKRALQTCEEFPIMLSQAFRELDLAIKNHIKKEDQEIRDLTLELKEKVRNE